MLTLSATVPPKKTLPESLSSVLSLLTVKPVQTGERYNYAIALERNLIHQNSLKFPYR